MEKNSTLLLTRLIDASVDGIFAFDRDCQIIAWNRGMERISGFSSADVMGKRVVDVFPFLREPGSDDCFAAALAGKGSVSENHPYGPSETGVFESHYSPLFDEENNIAGGIAVITDITARKQAEEAAHTAYRQLSFHVESSPLAVVEWDSDFRVSRWSESAERLFGWKAEEVIGKHVNEWRFVFADDEDAVALVTNRQREGVEVQGVQRNRNYTRDGSVLFCEWYNSVLHDDRGQTCFRAFARARRYGAAECGRRESGFVAARTRRASSRRRSRSTQGRISRHALTRAAHAFDFDSRLGVDDPQRRG